MKNDASSLSDKIELVVRENDVGKTEMFLKRDVKESVKKDYKNIVLAKRGEISWQEYIRRRNEIFGSALI